MPFIKSTLAFFIFTEMFKVLTKNIISKHPISFLFDMFCLPPKKSHFVYSLCELNSQKLGLQGHIKEVLITEFTYAFRQCWLYFSLRSCKKITHSVIPMLVFKCLLQ